jgi:hypothetical protein
LSKEQINEKKKLQQELTAERDILFRQFLRNPREIHLAREIKAIDDKIADLRSRK